MPGGAQAGRARRLDELTAFQRKCLAAHDARRRQPADRADCEEQHRRDCRARTRVVRMMTMNRYGSEYSTSTKRIIGLIECARRRSPRRRPR